MSDRGGAQNIWTLPLGGKMRQVTKFTDGRVLWPTIGYDGKAIVFERDFKIWQLDTRSGEAYALPITLVGSSADSRSFASHAQPVHRSRARSPTAENRAHRARRGFRRVGARRRRRRSASRTRRDPESAVDLVARFHAPRLPERARCRHPRVPLRFSEARGNAVDRGSRSSDQGPRFSPDGKAIAFVRGNARSCASWIWNPNRSAWPRPASSAEISARRPSPGRPTASGSSMSNAGAAALRNIYVVPRGRRRSQRRSAFWPTAMSIRCNGVPTGSSSCMQTGQRTETPRRGARRPGAARSPKYTEEKFDDLFKARARRAAERPRRERRSQAAGEAGRDRFRRHSRAHFHAADRADASNQPQISPDGKSLLFSANVGGQANLYLYPLDAAGSRTRRPWWTRRRRWRSRGPRQLTSTPGQKNHAQFTPRFERSVLSGRRPGRDHHRRRSARRAP